VTITVSTNSVTWLGNGATTVFSYSFAMPAGCATLRYTTAAGGAGQGSAGGAGGMPSGGVQTIVVPAAYTMAGVGQRTAGGGSQGGTVTYLPGGLPIPAGSLLTLIRTVPNTQPNSFGHQGGLWASMVEASDDALAMQIQQAANTAGRAIRPGRSGAAAGRGGACVAVQSSRHRAVRDVPGRRTAGEPGLGL
jgi:hypothetical protein